MRNAAAAVRSLDYCYDIPTNKRLQWTYTAFERNNDTCYTGEPVWYCLKPLKTIWIDNREVYSKVRGEVMKQKYFENNESDIISLYLRTVNTTIYALWAQGLTTFVLYKCTFIDCPQVTLLHEVDKAEILPINKLF